MDKTSQLALAKDEGIVPIPGTKRVEYLMENIRAAETVLSPRDIEEIESVLPAGAVKG